MRVHKCGWRAFSIWLPLEYDGAQGRDEYDARGVVVKGLASASTETRTTQLATASQPKKRKSWLTVRRKKINNTDFEEKEKDGAVGF